MNDREMRELLELTRENNKLLHKMRRYAILGTVTRIIYWAIIFGLPVALYYYYLQPYLGQFVETYNSGVDSAGEQIKGITDIFNIFGIGR